MNVTLLMAALLFSLPQDPDEGDAWPAWRGPLGTGFAPAASPPVTWSATENVRWRTPLPGRGHATPVVADGLVFVTTSVAIGEALEPEPERAPGAHDNAPVTHRQDFRVLALDAESGELLWSTSVGSGLPHERSHVSGSYASPSPATDGARVFASFGSSGVHALDARSGELLWSVDLGDTSMKHAHGEGGSPVLFGDTLAVVWDHEGDSFVVALEAASGKERWRAARDEPTSWATPIIVPGSAPGEGDRGAQLIVSGTRAVRGYDLATGDVLWSCGGLSHNVVASPVSAGGVVYAGSSYERQALLAIELDGARGDLTTSEKLLWVRRKGTPYVPSPLLYDDTLYYLRHYQPVLTRIDVATGEERGRSARLPGLENVYASLVGAAGRVYVTDLAGTTIVLSHAEVPEVLSVNRLDDPVSASPAIVGDALYLRGERFLWCLAER